MIERILENWLDKASEKSFQLPFCYMLIKQGHTIIHLTRHTLLEYGKDIISVNSMGEVCAYQLKGSGGGRIGYEQYRSELIKQLDTLTGIPVSHPSINATTHRSYFVTNGFLEEEVANAINLANEKFLQRNRPELVVNTIVRGEMLEMAKAIQLEFLPADLRDFNLFLDLYLEEGKGMLPKEKLAKLLYSLYNLEKVGAKQKRELCGSVAMIVALVISNFTNENNSIAEIEAWTMYLMYTFYFLEKHDLKPKDFKQEVDLAKEKIFNSLRDLVYELKKNPEMIYPRGPEENLIYHARLTWLSGFVACAGIYGVKTGNLELIKDVKDFLKKTECMTEVYGEAAFAPLLNNYWFRRSTDATLKPLFWLEEMFKAAIRPMEEHNLARSLYYLSPYHGIEECLCDRVKKEDKLPCVKYESYYAEPILQLLLRENVKQFLKLEWATFSRFLHKSFRFKRRIDFYLWHAEEGDEVSKMVRTGDWNLLRENALKTDEQAIPAKLLENPMLLPLILLVYPHRVNSEILKFTENWVRDKSILIIDTFDVAN